MGDALEGGLPPQATSSQREGRKARRDRQSTLRGHRRFDSASAARRGPWRIAIASCVRASAHAAHGIATRAADTIARSPRTDELARRRAARGAGWSLDALPRFTGLSGRARDSRARVDARPCFANGSDGTHHAEASRLHAMAAGHVATLACSARPARARRNASAIDTHQTRAARHARAIVDTLVRAAGLSCRANDAVTSRTTYTIAAYFARTAGDTFADFRNADLALANEARRTRELARFARFDAGTLMTNLLWRTDGIVVDLPIAIVVDRVTRFGLAAGGDGPLANDGAAAITVRDPSLT